jgi:predicted GNAT family N-acyltransferase
MIVRQIEAKDTMHIRKQVLRPDGDIEECIFEGDDSESTFHLGGYIDDELASIASFYLDNHPKIKDTYQFRLRGMATLPQFRKRGLSQALLQTAFPMIKQNNIETLWCNARTTAQGFYEKAGFEVVSDIFDIPGVGPHVVMIKEIL